MRSPIWVRQQLGDGDYVLLTPGLAGSVSLQLGYDIGHPRARQALFSFRSQVLQPWGRPRIMPPKLMISGENVPPRFSQGIWDIPTLLASEISPLNLVSSAA